jgi:hypothetical protein
LGWTGNVVTFQQYYGRLIGLMRLLANRRHNESMANRRVLGAFVAFWLSLALQPCAAAAIGDADCPHRPSEIEQPMEAVSDHCNPNSEAPTASVQSDCCEADEATVDGRLGQPDFKGDGKVPVAIPASDPIFAIQFDPTVGTANDPPDQTRLSIPLQILYCVYLI